MRAAWVQIPLPLLFTSLRPHGKSVRAFFKFFILAILFAFLIGRFNMSVQEIIDLLSDSVSEGKLNRNSQVTVMEYDHKGDGLKRIDLNHFKIEDKKITFSSFLY